MVPARRLDAAADDVTAAGARPHPAATGNTEQMVTPTTDNALVGHLNDQVTLHNPVTLTFDLLTSGSMHPGVRP